MLTAFVQVVAFLDTGMTVIRADHLCYVKSLALLVLAMLRCHPLLLCCVVGPGKALISILLIRQKMDELDNNTGTGRHFTVFLGPTSDLMI